MLGQLIKSIKREGVGGGRPRVAQSNPLYLLDNSYKNMADKMVVEVATTC